MASFTLVELHLEDGSFSANLPFSGVTDTERAEDDADEEADEDVGATADDEDGGRGKGPALVGVFLFLVVVAALVNYLSGEDDGPEVEIETADDGPVGVTVDTDGE